MYRAFLFLPAIAVLVFGYHGVIQNAIRRHPEVTLLAVQDHCRFMLGRRLGKVPGDELAEAMQRCNDIQVRSVDAAGGVLDPVIVRITVEAPVSAALEGSVLIFKSADINLRNLNFVSSLSNLASGRWRFNFFNTYSETTFHGSI